MLTDSLIHRILTCRPPNSTRRSSRVIPHLNIPSTFHDYEEYESILQPIIDAEFDITMDSEFLLPPGRPAIFEFSGSPFLTDRLENTVIFPMAIGPERSCVLLLPGTGYCVFNAQDKHLLMSTRGYDAFQMSHKVHFTGVDWMTPLNRRTALKTMKSHPWLDSFLRAQCMELRSINPEPAHRHEKAIITFSQGATGIYVWEGPPGTGKTKAIVHLLELLIHDRHYKKPILACAHSNDAVKNLAKAIHDSKHTRSTLNAIKVCWSMSKEREEQFPPPIELQYMVNQNSNDANVFLCTCNHAPALYRKFPLVIVDESAFCNEIDQNLAVTCLDHAHSNSKLLLVGDSAQLAPLLLSSGQRKQPFASFMTRCVNNSPMSCIVRFNISYRVGPRAAAYLGRKFYNNDFTSAYAGKKHSTILFGGRDFPELLFINVDGGVALREGKGRERYSYSNEQEANIVVSVIERITTIDINNIVVVTPYAQQVLLLQKVFLERSPDRRPRVTTVHSMQGSEAELVVLDLVRAGDTPMNLGSLDWYDDIHIMCVAISRQKTNLIVVGDSNFLKTSTSHWKEFVEFIETDEPVTDFASLKFA